ncbi:chitin binding peritrophin-A domain-containing protein [Nocardia goodfellowii]|uniref:chitin binding peritrophin-A domain-containing protein n=1 Tax=Nocardia goodfellowii TaxID=882446 RepID=UPI001AE16A90
MNSTSNGTATEIKRSGNRSFRRKPIRPLPAPKREYFPDTSDSTRYYRWAREGDGKLVRYDYQCGPGTYYNPETASCVVPGAPPPRRGRTTGCGIWRGRRESLVPALLVAYSEFSCPGGAFQEASCSSPPLSFQFFSPRS